MKTIYLNTLICAIFATQAHATDICSSKSSDFVNYKLLKVDTRITAISFCENSKKDECLFEKVSYTSYQYSNSDVFTQRRTWEQSAEMKGGFTFEGISAQATGSLKNTLEQSYSKTIATGGKQEDTSKQNFNGEKYYEITIENDFMKRIVYTTNLNQNNWGKAENGPFTYTEEVCIRTDYTPIFNAMLKEIKNQSYGITHNGTEWQKLNYAASVYNTLPDNDKFKEYANRIEKGLGSLGQRASDYWQWNRIASYTKDALKYYKQNDPKLAMTNFLAGYQSIDKPAHNQLKFTAIKNRANDLAKFLE